MSEVVTKRTPEGDSPAIGRVTTKDLAIGIGNGTAVCGKNHVSRAIFNEKRVDSDEFFRIFARHDLISNL